MTLKRLLVPALAALAAAGAAAAPARAEEPLSDSVPTPQAIAANAEFLAHAPPPPGEPPAVCVIDTGVTPIRDLAGQITERLAVGGGTLDDVAMDPSRIGTGHGTFVAAAIASQVDGWGSAGLWPRAKIVSVRVVPEGGDDATGEDYRHALDECSQPSRSVRVINLSLGSIAASEDDLRRLEDRIDLLHAAGINVVAGAGNTGGAVTYPGRFRSALAVAALDESGEFCHFSSRGPEVDLAALGCGPVVSLPDGRVARISGTSYAAPTVSAALAALRAYAPKLRAIEAEAILATTSRSGSLDVAAAFRRAGLGHLVHAVVPRPAQVAASELVAAEQPPGPSAAESTVSAPLAPNPTVQAHIVPPPATALGDASARPAKPRIRSLSFRRGRLAITLDRLPAGAVARFTIDRRTFVRRSARLRVRVAQWRRAVILVEDAWGVRSKPLVVSRRH